MTEKDGKSELRAPTHGKKITRNEILDVMADEGYAADDRKAWLKDVLTQVSQDDEGRTDPDRQKLMQEIREILHNHVSDRPEADDQA